MTCHVLCDQTTIHFILVSYHNHASSSLRLSHQGELYIPVFLLYYALTFQTIALAHRRFGYEASNTLSSCS